MNGAISAAGISFPASTLTKNQTKKGLMFYKGGGRIKIDFRYDDQCGNGHNTFSINVTYWDTTDRRYSPAYWKGTTKELLQKFAPKYAKYAKWHLCSAEGPLYYIENTLYHASNRDCWGKLKGEPTRYVEGIRFNGSMVTHVLPMKFIDYMKDRIIGKGIKRFTIKEIPYTGNAVHGDKFSPKYSIDYFTKKWHECPFNSLAEAEEFLYAIHNEPFEFNCYPVDFSEGKERDFKAARHSAVWPEATEEQLSLPKVELQQLLIGRLPALMEEFKKDIEELGFTY